MDWNRVEGNWKQLKGQVKEQWGKLTDDDLDVIAGRREQLEGKLQERYGLTKDRVRSEMQLLVRQSEVAVKPPPRLTFM
ncbi:MAG: CsbD family protein [Chitinophagaceae bacterium]